MALTWGTSFILIKRSLLTFTPLQIGSFRVAFSGVVMAFFGIPILRKLNKKEFLWMAIAGFFGIFTPMFMFPFAQTKVSSSLAGMINALEPIFTIVLGFILFGLRIKPHQILGAVIGFIGASTLLYFSEAGTDNTYIFYTLVMVLASLFYAVSALIVNVKLDHINSKSLTGGIYTIWMVPAWLLLVSSDFFGATDFSSQQTWESLGALGFLTIVSTTLAMFLFYKLIHETSAVFASTVSLIIPVVAVIWGIIDGETFLIWYALGGILILIGVYLIREKIDKPSESPLFKPPSPTP